MTKQKVLSFKYAYEGIKTAFKDEPNLKFHFYAGFIIILMGFYFNISQTEWLAILLTIAFVTTVELTNTAIEEVVDAFTQETHPSAKKAKDVAAGAVLISSIAASIIGAIVFIPHILKLISY